MILLFFLVLPGIVRAQSIQTIRKEKEKSEKEIIYLNKLLNETQNSKTVSTGRLQLLRKKITQSKRLLLSLNQEVKYLENQIDGNRKRIGELTAEKKSVLDLYAKLIYGLWKKRDKTHKLMFIFSASDFNQAYKRYRYFEQIQSYSRKQLVLINQLNDSLQVKNQNLQKLVRTKNSLLDDLNRKNQDLALQQNAENRLVKELQQKEKEITKKLKIQKKNRERLTRELNKLIAAQAKKSGGSSGVYKMTPEETLLSEDFEKNKGKLPWPVTQGIISEKFGIKVHPVYKRVKIENIGISITTLKNADIRSVFNGVVVEILFMPGFNNVIIVRHGSYMTVYSNLVDVNVKKGDKVLTKQVIGKVAYTNEEGSILNFQVYKDALRLDPELWLAH